MPLLITYRGVVYYAKGQNDLAMKDFNRAIEIDPKVGKAYYQRGMIYENQEKYAQAVPELKKAKSLGYCIDPVFIEIRGEEGPRKNRLPNFCDPIKKAGSPRPCLFILWQHRLPSNLNLVLSLQSSNNSITPGQGLIPSKPGPKVV